MDYHIHEYGDPIIFPVVTRPAEVCVIAVYKFVQSLHRWVAIAPPVSISTSSYNTNYSSRDLIKQLFEEDFPLL